LRGRTHDPFVGFATFARFEFLTVLVRRSLNRAAKRLCAERCGFGTACAQAVPWRAPLKEESMQIGVAYSEPGQQIWLNIEVPDESKVSDVIERSGILKQFPYIDLAVQKVGVFGRLVKLDAALRPGDRIEIYRAIIADPETVPRRDMPEE